ncbi:hypothetical protein Pmani_014795 [Petrolisthes manimaculis]|uniref:Uncharacterized protein n=1 Tax=Petrolisthes manimaculis TaxID=1843537 RepID=A0AAE1PTK3_9EUCA|nr:hypothetical protein Pmani_014795 [Petrolisthes manimaculis]
MGKGRGGTRGEDGREGRYAWGEGGKGGEEERRGRGESGKRSDGEEVRRGREATWKRSDGEEERRGRGSTGKRLFVVMIKTKMQMKGDHARKGKCGRRMMQGGVLKREGEWVMQGSGGRGGTLGSSLVRRIYPLGVSLFTDADARLKSCIQTDGEEEIGIRREKGKKAEVQKKRR